MTLLTTARAGFAGTATLAACALAVAPAHAATTPDVSAASYIASQMAVDGNHLSVTVNGTTYADNGLTIDGVLGLAAVSVGGTQINSSVNWLIANGAFYHGSATEGYAGSTAKQAVLLQSTGRSADALLTQLKGFQQPNGRFSDKTQWEDYSNTVSQAWALIALKRSGATVPTKSIDLLAGQQCSDGGFTMNFDEASCVSEPDATSFAIQALAANGRTSAIGKAATYLASVQTANGGLSGGSGATTPNTNSTGLASVAFSIAGKSANAARAASYVKSLQFGCAAPASLRGAIAYDRASFAAQTKAGSATDKQRDQNNRATPQAMLALTLKPYVSITANGAATVPAIDCDGPTQPTATPTTIPTTPTTATPTASPTSSPTASSSSPVTGPPVVTDGPTSSDGGADLGILAGAGALFATVCAGAMAYGRRRN